VGIVWELFGNCLELSNTDYQLVNVVSWELFGNCLGIVWELFGNLVGEWKKNEKKIKKSVKMFFSTKIVFYICTQEI